MAKKENGIFKVSKKELIKARNNRDKSKRGSDEEYHNHILNLYKQMLPYRKKVNHVILKEQW